MWHWFRKRECTNCIYLYLRWLFSMSYTASWPWVWPRPRWVHALLLVHSFTLIDSIGKPTWLLVNPWPIKTPRYLFWCFLLDVGQMKKWKSWESETSSLEYQFTNGNLFILKKMRIILTGSDSLGWVTQRNLWAGPFVLFFQIQRGSGSPIRPPS